LGHSGGSAHIEPAAVTGASSGSGIVLQFRSWYGGWFWQGRAPPSATAGAAISAKITLPPCLTENYGEPARGVTTIAAAEMLRGRPPEPSQEALVAKVPVVLLVGLMVLVFVLDMKRWLG